jgi:hypothetical protein
MSLYDVGHSDTVLDEKEHGGQGEAPPGWREITPKELAQSNYGTYMPDSIEFRQFILPEDKDADRATVQGVNLLRFYDGTGIAIVTNFWGGQRYGNDGWKKEQHVRFFAFGCDHEYKELSYAECQEQGIRHEGMCWHVNKCQKCGHVESRDSSD